MMAPALLRLICILRVVLALQIDDDCIVKNSFEKTWLWSEARLSAWIPEGEDGNVLVITMEYGDFYLKKYNAIIGAKGVSVTLSDKDKITNISSSSHVLPVKGWTDFVYATDANNTYISIAGYGAEMLTNFTTADTSDTATFQVSGSNLTLNCLSGIRVWDLKGTKEVVPLDASHEYRLTIFSKNEVLPTFKLGKETFSLSMGETGITSRGGTSKALPPFLQHNLTIACTQGDNSLTSCSIKLGENQTTDRIVYMNEMPQYLAVEGRPHDRFYLLLHPTHIDKEHTKESRQEDASDGVSSLLGVGIFTGIIIGVALMSAYFIYRKFANARERNTVESSNEENNPLLTDVEEGMQRLSNLQLTALLLEEGEKGQQSSANSEKANLLVQAIREGHVKQVHKLMKEVDPANLPHVEAHLQPNLEIVSLFNEHQPNWNELVYEVSQELNKRLDEIFKAAEAGLYKTGVDVYLRRYQLPGSVRDTKGRSLLHYIASCKDIDGGPLWEKRDIQDFLKDHIVFPNAVDYEGQTCLHELTISANISHNEIMWSNEKMTVENAWVELAKLLLEAGCDPLLENYALENPNSLAKEKLKSSLRNVFLNKNKKKDSQPKKADSQPKKSDSQPKEADSQPKKADSQPKEADSQPKKSDSQPKKSDSQPKKADSQPKVADSQTKKAESQPKKADSQPKEADSQPNKGSKQKRLLDAISKCDTLKIKRLLLSGYPLLPLHASTDPLAEAIRQGHLETIALLLSAGAPLCAKSVIHITPLEVANEVKLCAVLPALIRRECANRLRFEASKIIIQDPTYMGLRIHIEELAKEIEQKGSGHSCRFHTEMKPTGNNTARIYLCIAGSLGLSLVCQMLGFEDVFLQPLPHEEKPVKKVIENKQWHTLLVLYRDLNMSLFSTTDENMLPPSFLRDIMEYENQKLQKSCSQWKIKFLEGLDDKDSDILTYLQIVSKEGLVSIYHKLRKFKEVPAIDEPVEEFMGYNMLHIAAMHGQLNMVEYLLFNNANVMTKGKRNETALHLAALGGHRECMSYIQEHMKIKNYDLDAKAFATLTAEQIVEGYKALVTENSSVFLPEIHGREVFNNFAIKRTKIILEIKGSDFGISDEESFFKYTQAIASKQQNSCGAVEEEMEKLLQLISTKDPRFKGKRVTVNPRGNQPFTQPKASLQVYWEVSDPIFTGLEPKHDGKERCSLTLSLPDAFGGFSFKDEFFKAARNSLREYRFSSENMWLTYPYITKADVGPWIFIVYYDEGILRPLRVLLVPVLKVAYPTENKSNAVLKLLQPHFKDPLLVHIANNSKDSWSYIVVQLESEILAHMSENQRLVLAACTLLTNVLYSPWWFPKEQSRRHGRIHGYYAFGLVVLPQRYLRTLFFEEITSTSEEDWAPSKFLERVTSIFRRATREVEGKLEVRVIPLFLDSRHSWHKASPRVFSVIEYLESLKKK